MIVHTGTYFVTKNLDDYKYLIGWLQMSYWMISNVLSDNWKCLIGWLEMSYWMIANWLSYWLIGNVLLDDCKCLIGWLQMSYRMIAYGSRLTVSVFHIEVSTQFLVLFLECASLRFLLNLSFRPCLPTATRKLCRHCGKDVQMHQNSRQNTKIVIIC